MNTSRKLTIYNKALAQFADFKKGEDYQASARIGLEALLQSCEIAINGNLSFREIHFLALEQIDHLSRIIPLNMPLPEMLPRIEGILKERRAFYQQVRDSEHRDSLSQTLG